MRFVAVITSRWDTKWPFSSFVPIQNICNCLLVDCTTAVKILLNNLKNKRSINLISANKARVINNECSHVLWYLSRFIILIALFLSRCILCKWLSSDGATEVAANKGESLVVPLRGCRYRVHYRTLSLILLSITSINVACGSEFILDWNNTIRGCDATINELPLLDSHKRDTDHEARTNIYVKFKQRWSV